MQEEALQRVRDFIARLQEDVDDGRQAVHKGRLG